MIIRVSHLYLVGGVRYQASWVGSHHLALVWRRRRGRLRWGGTLELERLGSRFVL